jgi:hypothetical protein
VHIAFVCGNDGFHIIIFLQKYGNFGSYFVENSVDKALFSAVAPDKPNVKFVMKQIPNRKCLARLPRKNYPTTKLPTFLSMVFLIA